MILPPESALGLSMVGSAPALSWGTVRGRKAFLGLHPWQPHQQELSLVLSLPLELMPASEQGIAIPTCNSASTKHCSVLPLECLEVESRSINF